MLGKLTKIFGVAAAAATAFSCLLLGCGNCHTLKRIMPDILMLPDNAMGNAVEVSWSETGKIH